MDMLLGIAIFLIIISLIKAWKNIETLTNDTHNLKKVQTRCLVDQAKIDDLLIANYLTEQSRACDDELARSMRNVATYLYRKYEKTT